ncbi:DMBT1 protein, partial [Sylvietta virens]|nr:DMBT1 protein [Sylvietta virens]
CAGNVEIYYFGSWEKVCGYLWDMQDAQVVCRQLGCGSPLTTTHSFPSSDWYPYMITEVNCAGDETYLWHCPYNYQYRVCHHGDASVVCSGGCLCSGGVFLKKICLEQKPPTKVRQKNPKPKASKGRNCCEGCLEISRSGGRGTVCDNGWDLNDVQVVCRQLIFC